MLLTMSELPAILQVLLAYDLKLQRLSMTSVHTAIDYGRLKAVGMLTWVSAIHCKEEFSVISNSGLLRFANGSCGRIQHQRQRPMIAVYLITPTTDVYYPGATTDFLYRSDKRDGSPYYRQGRSGRSNDSKASSLRPVFN